MFGEDHSSMTGFGSRVEPTRSYSAFNEQYGIVSRRVANCNRKVWQLLFSIVHRLRWRANALPFSGVGAAKPALRFYTMSQRRPHQSATAC